MTTSFITLIPSVLLPTLLLSVISTSSLVSAQETQAVLPILGTQVNGVIQELTVGDRALPQIEAVATSRAAISAALTVTQEATLACVAKAQLSVSKRSASDAIHAAITRASVANAALNVHRTFRKASLDAGRTLATDQLRLVLSAAHSQASTGITAKELLQIRQFEVEIWWDRQWSRVNEAPRIPAGYRVFRSGEKRPPVGKVADLIAKRRKPIHTYTPFRIDDKHFVAFEELHTATIRDGKRISGEFRGVSVFVKSIEPELFSEAGTVDHHLL